jgi:hypothetical protein
MTSHRVQAFLLAVVLAMLTPAPVTAAPQFSEWGPPENLGCLVNSEFEDTAPSMSKDGLSLFFSSTRPEGSAGGNDLWVSQRASVDDAWGPPVNLGPAVNTAGNEGAPSLSRDEHWIFFNSNRDGSSDIWASYREHVHDDFGWQPPVKLGPGVNSPQFEAGASYFENDAGLPQLFLGKGPSALTSDIYVSELQPDGSFGPAVVVSELSSPQPDQRPSVRFDGLELFVGRLAPGNTDIWVSARQSVSDAWEAPTNLGPIVNSPFEDGQPHIAADRETLLFASNRPGGCGLGDLYVTTRTKSKTKGGND